MRQVVSWLLLTLLVLIPGCLGGVTDREGLPGPGEGDEVAAPAGSGGGGPPPEPEPRPVSERWVLRVESGPAGSNAPWRLAVPVPLWEGGPVMADWVGGATVYGDATVAVRELDEGSVMEVEGRGWIRIESATESPPPEACCMKDHVGAEWSAGRTTDGNVRAGIWSGEVGISIDYHATSTICYRDDHYDGEGRAVQAAGPLLPQPPSPWMDDDGPEWFPLAGGKRSGCGG